MSRLSVMPDTVGPSSNELRLGKRVLDLEKERDALAVSHHVKRETRGTNIRPN
jgi:hypothetical protein